MWNGTAETLNAKPTTTNTTASACTAAKSPLRSIDLPMSTKRVELATPYNNDMPYSITAEANTPSKKYFTPASLLLRSRLRHAANMYAGIDKNSSATNTETRSREDAIMTMPSKLVRSKNQYSPRQ